MCIEDRKQFRKIDKALAKCGKIPFVLFARFIFYVQICDVRNDISQIGCRIDAAVKYRIRRIVIDLYVGQIDFRNQRIDGFSASVLPVYFDGETHTAALKQREERSYILCNDSVRRLYVILQMRFSCGRHDKRSFEKMGKEDIVGKIFQSLTVRKIAVPAHADNAESRIRKFFFNAAEFRKGHVRTYVFRPPLCRRQFDIVKARRSDALDRFVERKTVIRIGVDCNDTLFHNPPAPQASENPSVRTLSLNPPGNRRKR